MRVRRWMTVFAAIMMAGASGQAQEAPPQGYAPSTLTVQARIVVLDVVVTDKKGNLVHRDLKRDDFTVLEDGQEQKILSFETPSAHRMPSSEGAIVNSATDLTKIGDAPVTILVLDELNSTFVDMSFSRQMMVKYLQSQPVVLKEPTVLMAAMNTTFQQLHDYTQDRDALIEVVKKHIPELPTKMEGSHGQGPGAVERMGQNLAALQQIAQASTGTPGRKNLIWVGNGFPSANLVGLPANQAETIETAIRRCIDRLMAARITMYTINPTANSTATVEADTTDDLNSTGGDAGPDPFGEGSASFSTFAPETGGIAYTGRNDLNNVIAEGIDKGQEYYTMSYSPTNRTEAAVQFRHIRVVMKDPDVRATTRDGYYPESAADLNPTLDKTMSEKQVRANLQLDLSGALTTTIAYNGLAVTAKRDGANYAIHVAEKGIAWSDPEAASGKQHEEATVAVAWYDKSGKVIGHVAREETFERAGSDDGANFTLPVALTGSPVRLRIVVRDALNGHMGTVDLTKF